VEFQLVNAVREEAIQTGEQAALHACEGEAIGAGMYKKQAQPGYNVPDCCPTF
jgi:hypothetical protein